MPDLYRLVQESAQALRRIVDFKPQVALVLGTGLGGVAQGIEVIEQVQYERLPHFPCSTVKSHEGNLLFGAMAGWNVAVLQGRFHYYEGYSLVQATLPVRTLHALGASILVINSAAGGLNPEFSPGDVMTVIDHINLIPENPLRGVSDERLGTRFPDMSRPYDAQLIAFAREAAEELKIPMRQGVYVAVPGPSLETRAETRMLRLLGADAVGMSTVPEVIVANSVGLRTLALTAITNVNIPEAMEPISVERVIETAALAEPKLRAIIEKTLSRLVL